MFGFKRKPRVAPLIVEYNNTVAHIEELTKQDYSKLAFCVKQQFELELDEIELCIFKLTSDNWLRTQKAYSTRYFELEDFNPTAQLIKAKFLQSAILRKPFDTTEYSNLLLDKYLPQVWFSPYITEDTLLEGLWTSIAPTEKHTYTTTIRLPYYHGDPNDPVNQFS